MEVGDLSKLMAKKRSMQQRRDDLIKHELKKKKR
jgi:hypothetical protein